jgi:hypothetical protein
MIPQRRTQVLTASMAFALMAAATAAPASGQLLAWETFYDGTADPADPQFGVYGGGTLLAQDVAAPGFTGQWSAGSGPNTVPSSNWQADIITLDREELDYELDGKVKFAGLASLDNNNRIVSRALDSTLRDPATTPIDRYYFSGLVNAGSSAPNKPGFALAGFTNDLADGRLTNESGAGPLFGAMFGFAGNDDAIGEETSGFDLVVRSRRNTGTAGEPVFEVVDTSILDNAAANTTYHVVLGIDAVAPDAGSIDTIEYWINPASLDAEADGSFETFSMNSPAEANFDRLSLATQQWGGTAFFDELRLGLDFASVTGLSAAEGILGDFSGDLFVGQDDLNLVLQNWGNDIELSDGVGTYDLQVGQEELNAVLGNWGGGNADTPNLESIAVPEPASAAALLGLTALGLRRRR